MGTKSNALREPWERQSGEIEREWTAFVMYRDMGTRMGAFSGQNRTTAKLHRMLENDPDQPSQASLSTWCKRNKWRARAALYDTHLDRIILDTNERTVREMHKRHVRLALRLQDIAGTELEKMVKKARDAPKQMDKLDSGNLAKFTELGVKLERLSRGESTEITEGRLDLSRLSLDELKALKALRDKAKPPG